MPSNGCCKESYPSGPQKGAASYQVISHGDQAGPEVVRIHHSVSLLQRAKRGKEAVDLEGDTPSPKFHTPEGKRSLNWWHWAPLIGTQEVALHRDRPSGPSHPLLSTLTGNSLPRFWAGDSPSTSWRLNPGPFASKSDALHVSYSLSAVCEQAPRSANSSFLVAR